MREQRIELEGAAGPQLSTVVCLRRERRLALVMTGLLVPWRVRVSRCSQHTDGWINVVVGCKAS
jgi:hypothetical protein